MTRAGWAVDWLFVAVFVLFFMVLAPMAYAQSANCGPHDVITARLAAGYGESRRSVALGANNTVGETFASEASGGWTITVTTPGGPTCLVASGQSYQAVDEPLPPLGEDS